MTKFIVNEKGQAQAPATVKMTHAAFQNHNRTSVYWLGGGGAMINSNGTILMIDPLLKGFDMPLLVDMVMDTDYVPFVDGVFVSHVDNDHYSRPTLKDLKDKIGEIHTSYYVAGLMKEECDIHNAVGHTWHDKVSIKGIEVEFCPADHDWQNLFEKYNYRTWEKEEYFGFYVRCEDCKIWYVGDSRLMDYQLHMEEPDVILFDFADNAVHIGLENAYKLANAYPNSKLVCIHWGCVDAPNASAFNGNPQDIIDHVINLERVIVIAPGEEFVVSK
ncbi:MAG: MBL fold metallo-hydrolase [Bacillota bacterium]|nr:MBL fold metallo-hydrolase [Bacillota bacterium]